MNYIVNITVTEQCLSVPSIMSVNGTVDIISCDFTFDETWADFPARQAIFSGNVTKNYVASIYDDTCIVPWEALKRPGEVKIAIVGTNTSGQVQRTETRTIIRQTATLQGGVNSIEPTPDQYAQFIAQVEEIIGEAGVMSVNGMTGEVTLTASDVDALPDTTVIPTKTSDLVNDSDFTTPLKIVVNGVQKTIVNYEKTAVQGISGVNLYYDGGVIFFPDGVGFNTGMQTIISQIPHNTSDLTNDSGFLTNAVTSFNGNTGAVTYTAPVTKVNNKTGNVTLAASDVGALPNTTTYVSTVNGSSGAVTINVPTKTSDLTNDSGFITSAPVQSVNGQTGAVVISNATTSSSGLMSSTDKQHLESVYADYSSALTALGV